MALPQPYDQLEDERNDDLEHPPRDKGRYTEDEYFALEECSRVRLEFVPTDPPNPFGPRLGIIRAMVGGTLDHAGVIANLMTALMLALRGTGNRLCRVFGSDLKIHTADGRNTFPDMSVVCGAPAFHRGRRDILTNPILVAEVLSPSTQADDRTDKRQSYQTIPALQHYLLLAADSARVEPYTREEGGWRSETIGPDTADAQIPLPRLGVTLALSDLYDRVEFDTEEEQ